MRSLIAVNMLSMFAESIGETNETGYKSTYVGDTLNSVS